MRCSAGLLEFDSPGPLVVHALGQVRRIVPIDDAKHDVRVKGNRGGGRFVYGGFDFDRVHRTFSSTLQN